MLEFVLFEAFWVVAFIIAFVHASRKSLFNACLFLFPAVIWSFLVELTGVHWWGIYTYSDNFLLSLFGVPISVALGWATIEYLGYLLITKYIHTRKPVEKYVESALVATLIDFILLEPFAFIFKWWFWKQNDFWFGAPLFNFIGWFLLITIYLNAYRHITSRFKTPLEKAKYFLLILTIGFLFLELFTYTYITLFGKCI
ncbi:MAG: carotenoid biosynthesis protein [archaeon]|jgi:putative membrane protein